MKTFTTRFIKTFVPAQKPMCLLDVFTCGPYKGFSLIHVALNDPHWLKDEILDGLSVDGRAIKMLQNELTERKNKFIATIDKLGLIQGTQDILGDL